MADESAGMAVDEAIELARAALDFTGDTVAVGVNTAALRALLAEVGRQGDKLELSRDLISRLKDQRDESERMIVKLVRDRDGYRDETHRLRGRLAEVLRERDKALRESEDLARAIAAARVALGGGRADG